MSFFNKNNKKSNETLMKIRAGNRSAALVVIFIIIIFGLLLRIAWIQFVRGEEYQKRAYLQQNNGRIIPANRGTIFDRNGNILAISVNARQVSVNQQTIIKEGEARGDVKAYQELVARALADILDLNYETVLEKVQSVGRYKEIARKIDVEVGEQVEGWIKKNKIKGVHVDEDVRRYYPNNSIAAHILGFTGRDDQGLVCGVEVALDKMLAGKAGRIVTEVDAKGVELPFDAERRIEPVNGYNATLTIDITIQYMVEQALQKAVIDQGVIGGAAGIVMNPNNGDILAMASWPNFNLNDPYACPPDMDPSSWTGNSSESVQILSTTVWRNKALTDTYEPGSTFKAITSAAVLEEGIANPSTIVNDAPLKLSGWTIRCWRKTYDHGNETFLEAIKNSCNPVFAKLSLKLGIKKFYSYLDAFGFTRKTGLGLTGEADSIIHKDPKEIDMAVAAFGQRLQITPIQLITAYSAIANGGNLLTPRIVKELTDEHGNVVMRYDTKVVRQVLSKETANTLLSMLEETVASGGGSNAYVTGYRVAGKTGTSQTPETDTTGRYVASFCGIAPADNPQIVILIVLDHPTVGVTSGGRQAAPVARELIEKILEYMEVERRYTELDKDKMLVKYKVPDLSELTLSEAIDELKKNNLSYRIVGDYTDPDARIYEQMPRPGALVSKDSMVVIYTEKESVKEKITVPDLMGLTLEEAYSALKERGLNMRASSLGTVVSQSIEPGKQVEIGSVVEIKLLNEDIETA